MLMKELLDTVPSFKDIYARRKPDEPEHAINYHLSFFSVKPSPSLTPILNGFNHTLLDSKNYLIDRKLRELCQYSR